MADVKRPNMIRERTPSSEKNIAGPKQSCLGFADAP